jgi:hypothetical protein
MDIASVLSAVAATAAAILSRVSISSFLVGFSARSTADFGGRRRWRSTGWI